MGNQLRDFVTDSSISVIPRLLLNAAIQYGVAGLGITIVCILRKKNLRIMDWYEKTLSKQSLEQLYVLYLPSAVFLYQASSVVINRLAF